MPGGAVAGAGGQRRANFDSQENVSLNSRISATTLSRRDNASAARKSHAGPIKSSEERDNTTLPPIANPARPNSFCIAYMNTMAPTKGKTKKVVGVIKLALDAGKATPAPPVGPALGSKGVNIMAFCKEYNAKTAEKAGYVIPVEITVYDDKSFTFVLKTPPASVLLLKAAGVEKGSKEPKSQKVGKITAEQVRVIAQEKLPDLNCVTIESAMRIIAGTAANMGIDIDPPVLESKKKQLLL
ncbi:hypothetical protein KSP40_PGU002096 [Platanthera guangdongensis]|uniref:50S ribosomal protein L11, chloroplastic n=1 Tax=Platanthera guangdongensis TaxID=2320717 RepID=A0ABR2MNN9_9ASPA